MAKRNVSNSRRKSAGNTSGSMLMGIFIGMIVASLVIIIGAWFLTKGEPFRVTDPANRINVDPAKPIALPGKPGDGAVETPNLDLIASPSAEENVTAGAVAHDSEADSNEAQLALNGAQVSEAPAAPTGKPVETSAGRFFIQVGAFQNTAEADNMKARLAFLGLNAEIQNTPRSGQPNVFRVRLGPYGSPSDLNPVRQQLASEGIDAAVVRGEP